MDVRFERNDNPHLPLRLDPQQAFVPEPGELERRWGVQPEAHFLARTPEGRAVATGAAVVWSGEPHGVAWISGMVVAPDARRQGIARRMLDHLVRDARARGARVVALDATADARPLYASAGFAPLPGVVQRWRRSPGSSPRAPQGERRVSIYPISSCEVMDLWAYDKPRFGANRVPWLASGMARFPERTFVAFDRASGAIVGHVQSHERWIGPLVADSPDAAEWLLYAAERAGAPPAAIPGPGNAAATALLERAGYQPEGEACVRMTLGGPLPGRPETQYLASGWAFG